MKIGDVDISDQSVFIDAVPHDYFRLLREEDPVHWQPDGEGGGFWAVTRYADIVAVEKNPALFSSRTNISPQNVSPEQLAATVDHVIILTDPPRHTFLRSAFAPAFTPKALNAMEPRIREVVTQAIDAVIEQGTCDFLDVAAYIPIEVVADMMGVAAEDRPKAFDWANAIFGSSDPELSNPHLSHLAGQQMFGYALTLAARYRAQPADNLFSRVANLHEGDGYLPDMDVGAAFLILATAGNETTRTQLLHSMLALIEHPEAAEELRRDRSLIDNFIEESLRWYSPLITMARIATEDTELGGQRIRKGERVALWFSSANRDAAVFADPDRFDIRRANARDHVAFGARGSIHHCLGSMLARVELRVAFEEILDRLTDVRLAGPVRRLRSNFTNGIKSLPIRFTPGPRKGTEAVSLYATKRHGAEPADAHADAHADAGAHAANH